MSVFRQAIGQWTALVILVLCRPFTGVAAEEDKGAETWEPFAERFRPALPADVVMDMKNDQAAAYARHLQDPENPVHITMIASISFRLQAYHEAAEWYVRMLRHDPDNSQAPAYFAECLYHAGHPDLARNLFEQFELHGRAIPITSIMLAEIHYRKERMAEARTILERVMAESESRKHDPVYALLRKHVTHNLNVLQGEEEHGRPSFGGRAAR